GPGGKRDSRPVHRVPPGAGTDFLAAPRLDLDEWRDEPVRHRYVHGGFSGTDTRFSFYFPPAERYEGRFFHPLMPISGTEHGAPAGFGMMAGSIGFSIPSRGHHGQRQPGRRRLFPREGSRRGGLRARAATRRYSGAGRASPL